MRYTYLIVVPGTENIRGEGDRIEPYATQGGPITKAEKKDAASDAKLPPEVKAVRDLKNMAIPPEEKNPEALMAYVEVHPLYDTGSMIIDMLGHMDNADMLEVPEVAVQMAPGVTPAMKDAYYVRLADIAQEIAAEQAQGALSKIRASLPPTAQALIPAQVDLTIDGAA